MNINEKEKAIGKLNGYKDHEIERMIEESETDIMNYKFSIQNYDEAKMMEFGLPFLDRLKKFHDALMVDLERRTG